MYQNSGNRNVLTNTEVQKLGEKILDDCILHGMLRPPKAVSAIALQIVQERTCNEGIHGAKEEDKQELPARGKAIQTALTRPMDTDPKSLRGPNIGVRLRWQGGTFHKDTTP
jgi:hypothetical protein